jgi:hypothetical protein
LEKKKKERGDGWAGWAQRGRGRGWAARPAHGGGGGGGGWAGMGKEGGEGRRKRFFFFSKIHFPLDESIHIFKQSKGMHGSAWCITQSKVFLRFCFTWDLKPKPAMTLEKIKV